MQPPLGSHIHLIAACGTAMGSLAGMLHEQGYRVTGSDSRVYPPMSTMLEALGIDVRTGFSADHLIPAPDLVVIGNAISRGNPEAEAVLSRRIPYRSLPEVLRDFFIRGKCSVVVTGTHGKTTTTALIAHLFTACDLDPSFLVAGVPQNFDRSNRLGQGAHFIVEGDEYDSAFFAKWAKFFYYLPEVLIVNNIEFDHADIFPDLGAIQTQFHHLLRSVPGRGQIIAPSQDEAVNDVLKMGCWTPVVRFGAIPSQAPITSDSGALWSAGNSAADGSEFDVMANGTVAGRLSWPLLGDHNIANALGAIAAAAHAGVAPNTAIEALSRFKGVKRRMEFVAEVNGTTIYDDFAHHPTAIRTTLRGLRDCVGSEEIIAIVEPRTHTMSLGTLREDLVTCCAAADAVYWFRNENMRWDLGTVVSKCVVPARLFDDLGSLMQAVADLPPRRRHVVILSNGGFQGIHQKLPGVLGR